MQYKSNLFEVGLKGNTDGIKPLMNGDFELAYHSESRTGTVLRIRAKKDFSGNEILRRILPLAEITSFNEVIPSMNEVFIHVVESQKN